MLAAILLKQSSKSCKYFRNSSLDNIGKFSDTAFAASLKADLENGNDSKRSLKEVSAMNANIIFGALGLDDPNCDANGDGTIKGDELKCLNYAWKAFVPSWLWNQIYSQLHILILS